VFRTTRERRRFRAKPRRHEPLIRDGIGKAQSQTRVVKFTATIAARRIYLYRHIVMYVYRYILL